MVQVVNMGDRWVDRGVLTCKEETKSPSGHSMEFCKPANIELVE